MHSCTWKYLFSGCLPGAILWTMPAPIRVIILYYAGLLLYDFSPSTGACHCRAQEDVDNEHDKEHDSKCYAQVQQPWGVYTAFTQLLDHCKVSNGYRSYRKSFWKYRLEAVIRMGCYGRDAWIKVKCKVFLSMPWRHIGGTETLFCSFLNLALDKGEFCCYWHSSPNCTDCTN